MGRATTSILRKSKRSSVKDATQARVSTKESAHFPARKVGGGMIRKKGKSARETFTKNFPAHLAWGVEAEKYGWEPRHTKPIPQQTPDTPYDRFDLGGTSGINELVLRHGTMKTSDLKTARQPVLYQRCAHPRTRDASPFLLDRYLSNLVRALVHPLHNYLQCHHSLHNADEVQIMLMPKEGPIALADRAFLPPRSSNGVVADPSLRRCYVATNNETLTEECLQAAVCDWGVAGVFQISEFVLVPGEKRRHAEQKLLEYLRTDVLSSTATEEPLRADEKVLVVGERLPCVTCRLFAIAFESMAVMLPSHGHMYLSTLPAVPATAGPSGVKAAGAPATAAALLQAAGRRRVLL